MTDKSERGGVFQRDVSPKRGAMRSWEDDSTQSAYAFVRRTIVRFRYHELGRAGKGLVKQFLAKATGLSRAQLTRLIAQHRRTGNIRRPPQEAPDQR